MFWDVVSGIVYFERTLRIRFGLLNWGLSLHIWGDLMTLLEKITKYDKISKNTGFVKFLKIKSVYR